MLPLNIQPIEKQSCRDDGVLDVVSIWYTIQGEGPFAGMPALFIRLAGCDIRCPLCDTDYTSNRKLHTIDEIVSQLRQHLVLSGSKQSPQLVVLTGGEPLRQNIAPLIRRLVAQGFLVQVETNGTLYLPTLDELRQDGTPPVLVCSPKTGKINDDLQPYIRHLKYVVAAGKIDPNDGLPLDSLGADVKVARPWPGFQGEIYIQPLDVQDPVENQRHIQAATEVCLKYGYRLCLQIHKLVGLD